MQADTTTLAPTDAEIDAAYRKVWSTIPHAQRLSAFAHEIATTLAARWGAPAPASVEPVMWAYKYADGTWHDASATEHSAGMRPLYEAAPPAQDVRVPLSEDQWQSIGDAIEQSLHHYRCSTIFEDGEGDGLPLLDALSQVDGTSTTTAKAELEGLCDHIFNDLRAHGITAAQKETP